MKELNIKNYAHIGDSVWELFVREKTISMTENLQRLHELTVSYVNAAFQSDVMNFLTSYLTEDEKLLIKRGGNIKTSPARKIDRNLHRIATKLEVLLGYNYLHNKKRLEELFEIISKNFGL